MNDKERIAKLSVVVEDLKKALKEARHNMPTSRLHAIDSITEALARAANPSKTKDSGDGGKS